MIWKTPSALIYNEWKNLMDSVFYAIVMMSMEGSFIAVFESVLVCGCPSFYWNYLSLGIMDKQGFTPEQIL